jgi:trans-2-decenoyl-[acyl-carrier protein] isomerase
MSIEFYEESGIFRIVMAKQPSNNMDFSFLSELRAAVNAANEDNVSKTVLISSSIPFGFSSGLDLAKCCVDHDQTATAKNVTSMVREMHGIAAEIISSDKVYVCAVTHATIGCGATISLCSDFCFADKTAWFWFPDTMYGGISADTTIDLLPRLVGLSRAKQMLMTNDRLSAKKAYDWGLIYKITEETELLSTAVTFCKRLQKYSYLSLKETKKLLNENIFSPFKEEAVRKAAGADETFLALSKRFTSAPRNSKE